MDPRGWWTVVLTALAGPLGSFGLGLGLARVAEVTAGGMAVLAWAIVGLWLGAPLAALIVFGICLVTLLRGAPLRRWAAMLVMIATAIAEAVVMIIGLRLTGGMAQPQLGIAGIAVAIVVVLGAGAYVALTVARRPQAASASPDGEAAVDVPDRAD
jgi:hypothetical protein